MGSRALKDRWTLASDDGFAGAASEIAQAIRDEIDREILGEVRRVHLANQGYHEVRCGDPANNGDLMAWLQGQVRGSYEVLPSCVMFLGIDDAVAFSMVWA